MQLQAINFGEMRCRKSDILAKITLFRLKSPLLAETLFRQKLSLSVHFVFRPKFLSLESALSVSAETLSVDHYYNGDQLGQARTVTVFD